MLRWRAASSMIVFLVSVAAARMSAAAAPAALGACGDSIRGAAIDLQGDARRAISACVTRGVACVVGPADGRESCCSGAAAECASDLGDVTAAKQRFANVVATRRCGVVPFADVLDAQGLGYGALGPACSALDPPGSVADLPALADCAGRLDVARSACAIVSREVPRAVDGLACMGIEPAFHDATDADPHACGGAPPPQPCGPGATVTVVASLGAATAGAVIQIVYPDGVSLPGSGTDPKVVDRVLFAASGLTVVNDADLLNDDGVDETLIASLVGFADNPPGPFATITFDCAEGRIPPVAGDFTCTVPSASDSGGLPVTAQCSLAVQ